MMWRLDADGPLPRWCLDQDAGEAALAFTTRRGGVSKAPYESLNLGRSTGDRPAAVNENRRRALATVGLGEDRLATAGQVHGAAIREVHAPGHTPDCDALFTRERGIALAITTADCLPLILLAPGAVAVA